MTCVQACACQHVYERLAREWKASNETPRVPREGAMYLSSLIAFGDTDEVEVEPALVSVTTSSEKNWRTTADSMMVD